MATSSGEQIAVDWAYVRDTIHVNDALLGEIRAEVGFRGLAAGAVLALVAREIVHDPGYVLTGLTGHPLVLVAENYRGNGGGVDASGVPGNRGGPGATGADGQGQQGQTGGAGGLGGNGQPGGAASQVWVLAATLTDLRITARGGHGGAGGPGGTGGHGYDAAEPPHKPDHDPPEPGNGGPGGQGGVGAVGGPGALILIDTVTPSGLSTDGSGGDAGGAGRPGEGGRGGKVGGGPTPLGDPGPAGPPGTPGPGPGPSVQPVIVTHPVDDWWALIRLRLGMRAHDWADYRTSVGEYLFRAYAPGKPDRRGYRDAAAHEFDRALTLFQDQARAAEMLRYIASNLAPIGQPYNLEILPDFPRFESVVTDYDAVVKSMYDNALNLLLSVVDAGQKSARLAADMAHISDMAGVLALEEKAAKLALEGAKGKADVIDQQLEETRTQISAVREEIAVKRLEWPPGNDLGPLLGAAIAVAAAAAAISAFATGGATIVAFLAAANVVMTGVGAVEGFDVNTGKDADGDQLISWWDWSDPGKPKLKPDDADKVGGLAELVNKSKKFIDAGRAISELTQAKVDGKLESRERDLIARQLDLTRQRGLQLLEVNQKALLAVAADAKIAVNKADLENLHHLQVDWASDIGALSQISRRLIAQTQAYVDVLIRFGFYAHRALDLYTLSSNTSPQFSFDIGYLHPDDVENTYQPLARGDDSRVIPLLGEYLDSWARMPELVTLRAFYDDYQRSLQYAPQFVTISTPEVLAALRTNGSASFTVPLENFPAAWSELKVERVSVAFVGATCDNPAVVAYVEHEGAAVNRLRDGTVRTVDGWPLSAVVEATFDKRDPGTPAPADARQSFWGRSPATTWRVSIEPLSAKQGNLNLDGLTALYVTIRYAFYAPPSTAGQAVPAMPVAADYDGDQRPDNATWNSADGTWHIEPSSGGPARVVPWGQAGDIPVPADYDRDGRAELAVFRPSDGTLLTRPLESGPTTVYLWRTADYLPSPADHPGMDTLANGFRVRAADLSGIGRQDEAVAVQTQARDAYRQLAEASEAYRADLAQTMVMLGIYLSRAGRDDEAIAAVQEGIAKYREIGDAAQEAWASGNLAALYRAAGRPADAVDAQQDTVDDYRALAAGDPAYRTALAMSLVFLGLYLEQAGRHDESVAPAREAVETYRQLADEPDVAWALGNLGARLQADDRPGDAADAWREARDIYQKLAAADPVYRPLLAQSAYRLAVVLVAADRRADALAAAQQAVTVYQELNTQNPGVYASETDTAVKLRDSLAQ
ncbi:tetratricopeptide repeat protein [Streptomyces sp. NPDC088350]|uniref:tetratricopeptide repeat protein n=1 Tax=Streptomyces sp. NPDC088350 TaxID=3365854 RepID=UPI0038303424